MSRLIIAGTGHRPNKLGGYGQEVFDKLVGVAEAYLKENPCTGVISGMALGWDMALAQAAINTSTPFAAAVPFIGQETKWPSASQEQYKRIISEAKKVIYTSEPGYSPYKMQVRNVWMVDRCDVLLAMWDGSDGGTGNCVKYANSVGKQITNLYNRFTLGR